MFKPLYLYFGNFSVFINQTFKKRLIKKRAEIPNVQVRLFNNSSHFYHLLTFPIYKFYSAIP